MPKNQDVTTPDTIASAVRAELELLTPNQVCDLLQVRKSWLYDEVQRGDIPHVRLGRQLRFRASELNTYLTGEWAPEPKPEAHVSTAPVRGRPRKN